MEITLSPIAIIKNSRTTPIDDHWSEIISEIELADNIPTEAFNCIGEFSHLEIIFYFDQVKVENIVFSGRPRGNPNYPLVGIFGQRKKDRPNKIGLCTVGLLEHNGRILKVKNLDAMKQVIEGLTREGVEFTIYDGCRVEPKDSSYDHLTSHKAKH